ELSEQISERQMRSADRRPSSAGAEGGERFGVRCIGLGRSGGERLHYPDMLLRTATGHTVAVELELSPKSGARLQRIIGRYVADRRVDAVLYLVDDDRRAREITATARRLGASKLIHVQRVQWSEQAGPPRAHSREAARSHARTPRGASRSLTPAAQAER
ncbi:MAG TPA: hypothetical protein VG223_05420, partial [Solirubrobacteraceae bacterium]|nr:hypothetical protein [Solirubrobacteraceae bacterium]